MILLVLAGAERRHDQRLRLAAGEQRRAVGARQDADLREDRADGRQIAPVDAALVVEDVPAHDLGLGVVERLGDLSVAEISARRPPGASAAITFALTASTAA